MQLEAHQQPWQEEWLRLELQVLVAPGHRVSCRTVCGDRYHMPLPRVIADLHVWEHFSFKCFSSFP